MLLKIQHIKLLGNKLIINRESEGVAFFPTLFEENKLFRGLVHLKSKTLFTDEFYIARIVPIKQCGVTKFVTKDITNLNPYQIFVSLLHLLSNCKFIMV